MVNTIEQPLSFRKLMEKAGKSLGYRAFVMYFFDSEHKNAKLHPLPQIPSILDVSNTQESFEISKVGMYIDGKPTIILSRGFPHSVELEIDDSNKVIREKDLTQQEFDRRCESVAEQNVNGRAGLSFNQKWMIGFIVVLVVMITNIICSVNFIGG